jgi:hypothetical protein
MRDDEIRSALLRERLAQMRAHDAAGALDELRPTLRRARHVRIATVAGAAAVSVAAVAVLGLVLQSRLPGDADSWSDRGVPIDHVDHSEPADPDPGDRDAVPLTSTDEDEPDEGSSQIAIDATVVTLGSTTSVVDRSDHDDERDPENEGDTGEGDGGLVAPTIVVPPSPVVDDPPTTTGPPATVVPVAEPPAGTTPPQTTTSPTTAPPTTAPPTEAERFTSSCGDILALVGPGTVEIVRIEPEPGYRAVLEDPDHGVITVHFEGPGEDCEVRVGDRSAARSRARRSSGVSADMGRLLSSRLGCVRPRSVPSTPGPARSGC